MTILALALIGCGEAPAVEAPAFQGTFTLTQNAKSFEDVIFDAASLIEGQTGIELSTRNVNVDVVLNYTMCNGTAVAGCTHSSGHDSKVVVGYPGKGCFAETAIVHELGHVARTILTGDGDSDHKDRDFWEKKVGGAERQLLNNHCPRGW